MVGSGCDLRCSSFSRGRIDHKLDLRHAVCREAALLRVFADHLLVGSDIDAVDFVPSYITVEPLNLWSQILQHVAGFLRNRCHFLRRYIPHSGDIAFDDVFRHAFLLCSRSAAVTRLPEEDSRLQAGKFPPAKAPVAAPTLAARGASSGFRASRAT